MSDLRNAGPATSRVLIVDDAPLPREIARLILEGAGRGVDTVGDAESAIEALWGRHYDVVLMDLGLPGMDGLAASTAIRHLDGPASRVPIVALTSRSGGTVREECRAAGMDGYIAKPFLAADLVDHVSHWAARGREANRSLVWDPIQVEELRARLGAARLREALLMFQEKLRLALDDLRAAPDDLPMVERLAHGLVSTAGMLGFVELCAESRDVMQAAASGADADMSGLEAAAGRVLERLRDRAQAALA